MVTTFIINTTVQLYGSDNWLLMINQHLQQLLDTVPSHFKFSIVFRFRRSVYLRILWECWNLLDPLSLSADQFVKIQQCAKVWKCIGITNAIQSKFFYIAFWEMIQCTVHLLYFSWPSYLSGQIISEWLPYMWASVCAVPLTLSRIVSGCYWSHLFSSGLIFSRCFIFITECWLENYQYV